MCCCSEYIDVNIIIPRHCYPMHSEVVSEYDQKIPLPQTADNPVALGGKATQQSRDSRKTKYEKQPALYFPNQDGCRSVCAHLCIQQTYTDFTYICAVVNEAIVKLRPHNLLAHELWNQQIRLTVKDIHMFKWVYYNHYIAQKTATGKCTETFATKSCHL